MQEGVIKFAQDFTKRPAMFCDIESLLVWRRIFYGNGLIGQKPQRYDGAAYGNLSQRIPPYNFPFNKRSFLISGSQTSGLEVVTREHFSVVIEYYPDKNLVMAAGPVQPSSETMTHGTLYDLDDSLRFVFHAHCPFIWQNSENLCIPATNPWVEYGTVEMAKEVRRLFSETDVASRKIFSMRGHQDGVVSFGRTADEAGFAMLKYLPA